MSGVQGFLNAKVSGIYDLDLSSSHDKSHNERPYDCTNTYTKRQ